MGLGRQALLGSCCEKIVEMLEGGLICNEATVDDELHVLTYPHGVWLGLSKAAPDMLQSLLVGLGQYDSVLPS